MSVRNGLLSLVVLFLPAFLLAQESQVIYQYPLPNSENVSTASGIGLRINEVFLDPGDVVVLDGHLKPVECASRLTSDRHMLLISPRWPFQPNDRISVRVDVPLQNGEVLHESFSFRTALSATRRMLPGDQAAYASEGISPIAEQISSALDTLPPDVPQITVKTDVNPAPGSMFLSDFGFGLVPYGNYLFVLDKDANVLDRVARTSQAIDFKPQPTGIVTFYDFKHGFYYGMDHGFSIVDSFGTADSVTPDMHELTLLPNGGYFIIGLLSTRMYLGGLGIGRTDTGAIVSSVIQEFDKDRNLIFEWRGLDHYNVKDAQHVDFTAKSIDFEHANSLDTDLDGNFIFSNRHLSEITKIDRKTGRILWRFGGVHNQFALVGDTLGISYQHDARILPNGHLLLFDNGNFRGGGFSRAVEYRLDTTAMTATLVWQFQHSPQIYATALGSVQRLSNGNTLIGWGANTLSTEAASEVNTDNNVALEFDLPKDVYSYRVYKQVTEPFSGVAPASSLVGVAAHIVMNGADRYLEYSDNASEPVTVTCCDLLGRREGVVFEGRSSVGENHVSLPGSTMRPGIHFIRIQNGSQSEVLAYPVSY